MPTKVPTKVPTKHPSAHNRKLCLSWRALHHDELTPDNRGAHALASGPRLTASLRSDDSSSHPLSCCAVACPISPLFPGPPAPQAPSCVLANQPDPDTKHASPINTLWASWSGNRRCCRWGHVGAEQAMLICKGPVSSVAQHNTQQQRVIPSVRLPLPFTSLSASHATRASKNGSSPMITSHVIQVLSLQPQVACVPACLK